MSDRNQRPSGISAFMDARDGTADLRAKLQAAEAEAKRLSHCALAADNECDELRAEVARLAKEKRIAENDTADADRAIDALKRIIGQDRTRIAELEAEVARLMEEKK